MIKCLVRGIHTSITPFIPLPPHSFIQLREIEGRALAVMISVYTARSRLLLLFDFIYMLYLSLTKHFITIYYFELYFGEGNNDITPVDQAGVRILSAKMKKASKTLDLEF